jgi:catechol 2,3-dioxygenase-like lactoylglutathione lyase family enzyme
MLGELDHVGYLAGDLDTAVAEFQDLFDLPLVRRFERPQFALQGVYLGSREGHVELFTFSDHELIERRLGAARVRLDHVAYRVADIDATLARLRSAGVRFCGPDMRGELHEPVDLGGTRHLWTLPETALGQFIQLIER